MVLEFYYHSLSPPSQSVRMILKELNIECKEIAINLFTHEHKSESYKAINPVQKVPAIVDGDFKLSESRAIAFYLCSKYESAKKEKKLYPREEQEMAKMHQAVFRDYDNMNMIVKYMNTEAIYAGKADGPAVELYPKIKAILSEMDGTLSKTKYFGGNHLTILDFFALNSTGLLSMAGFQEWSDYPHLEKWINIMEKLPYYDECYAKPLEERKRSQMFQDLCQKYKTVSAK